MPVIIHQIAEILLMCHIFLLNILNEIILKSVMHIWPAFMGLKFLWSFDLRGHERFRDKFFYCWGGHFLSGELDTCETGIEDCIDIYESNVQSSLKLLYLGWQKKFRRRENFLNFCWHFWRQERHLTSSFDDDVN